MTHQGCDDRQIHTAIHQVGGKAVAQCPCGHSGPKAGTLSGGGYDVADILVAKASLLDHRLEERAALATLE
jgi:hypothetical protein